MIWKQNWYPLGHVRELSKNAPSSHRLLDQPLVVWRQQGSWCVAHDACPHRGAPLSSGSIDAGQLTCTYHGWKFGADGALTSDPQSATLPRCGLRTRPSKVCERGLLWVWGDDAPPPQPDAEPKALDAQVEAKMEPFTDWTSIRVRAPFRSVVENSIDAAHALHTHHGVLPGLDRKRAMPYPVITAGGNRPANASTWDAWMTTSGADGTHRYVFRAPHTVGISFDDVLRINAFVVPLAADETLLLSAASTPHTRFARLLRIRAPHARALAHRLGVTIAQQDARVMALETDGATMPMEYDGAITRVRRYMRKAGDPIPLPRFRDPPDRRAMSAWHMHGCRCPTCRSFVRDLTIAKHAWMAGAFATAGTPQSAACVALAVGFDRLEAFMRD